MVRAGNAGWSGWIDERGYVRWEIVHPGTGSIYVATAEAAPIGRATAFAGRQSFYVRWGDWFVALSALFAGGLVTGLLWTGGARESGGRLAAATPPGPSRTQR